MTAEAHPIVADPASRSRAQSDARCPHVVFRDVLGAQTVAGLLDYVAGRESEFKPAVVRNRESGERRIDASLRNCAYLADLGPFEAPIKTFLHGIATPALAQLHLTEPSFVPKDFEISAYRNGSHFGAHIDTDERINQVRILSCVYYFAATPRRFSGGELRLHGFPTLSGGPPPFVDVAPDTDTLVAFPSWLRHEVLPVRVPSGAWTDGRFTINCWIHRVSPSAGDRSSNS